MGCSVSKPSGEDNAAAMVSVCRERKRLMKLAIRKRHALAIAQVKYNQSLFSVSREIRAFSGSQETRLVITEPVLERVTEEESDEDREVCEHFYDNNDGIGVPLMQNVSENNSGWDFFNLFDGWKTEVVNVYGVERKVKKDEKKSVARDANVSREDTGKELFEVLKEVEKSFVKGSECGAEVSRMLEVSGVHHLEPRFDKFQESPMKSPFQSISPLKSPFQSISPMKSPFRSISWGRSTSSSSSCKSFLAFSSPCSSTWTDVNIDCFDEHNGMVSGSHSLTLGRLYAWENKLYQEVKVGEYTRKLYQQKCWQLKNQDAKCKGLSSPEKTKAEVRDLYSRILVAIRQIETVSQRIEKLKHDELYPQLVELLNGLMSTWKIMLETHKAQKQAISEVKRFTHRNFMESCTDSHRLTTFQLETEIQNWCFCFSEYLSAQKAYAEALNGWLSKFTSLQFKPQSRDKYFGMPSTNDPPSFFITREWLNLLNILPGKNVTSAMKSLGKDMRALWVQQGDEQLQKRKIDGLTKELNRSITCLKREEEKAVETVGYRAEYLNDRQRLLDDLRKKLEIEKEKHCGIAEETRRNTLRVFMSGFGSVFDSMIDFSKGSEKMYADLVADIEKKVHK